MGRGGLKKLRAWQKSKDLAVYIYQITNTDKIDINIVQNVCPWTFADWNIVNRGRGQCQMLRPDLEMDVNLQEVIRYAKDCYRYTR